MIVLLLLFSQYQVYVEPVESAIFLFATGFEYFVKGLLFVKRLTIQEYLSGMMDPSLPVEPVAINRILVGIIISEKGIWYDYFPYSLFLFFPSCNDL